MKDELTENIELKQTADAVYTEQHSTGIISGNIIYTQLNGAINDTVAIALKDIHLRFLNESAVSLCLLVDVNKAGILSARARKFWKEVNEHKNMHKVAIIGIHPVARILAAFVIGTTNIQNIKLFALPQNALDWLKE